MFPALSPLPLERAPGLLGFGFANPWLLWGLVLAGIPILIHFLHRRSYRDTDWAAMRFLLEAARKNSRRLRLEQLVLLAVRTLLLLLAALAFAEPLVQAVGGRQARARAPVQRLVMIDASFSMGARADGRSRFERAKAAARQIVSSSLAGDAIHLLSIAERSGTAIVREPAFQPEAVVSEIDRLELTDEPGDLVPALREAAQLLADPRAPVNKEVIFISDFQRVTWAGDAAQHADRHEAFRRLADQARIVLVDVGDGRQDNVALTSLRSAEPVLLRDHPTRLRAAIRNFGATNLAGLRVELYVDSYLFAFSSVNVPAREEAIVEFPPYEFRTAGDHVVEARLPADALAADNQRWLSVPVSERMNVLVVSGREGGRPADDASFFIRTVLAPGTSRQSWSGATRPKVIPEADLAAEDLSPYDCVFLCNVALVTPSEAKLLDSYARGGGGIVFLLGDRVKPENYNALLYRDGQGILPAALGGAIGDARDRDPTRKTFTFEASDLSHPIVAPFRGNPSAGLNRVVTLEYLQAKLATGTSARVALRFDSGDPAILERQVGTGRCVLVTTTADVSWSAWPVHPTFPPLIHEIVRFAAGGRWQERQRLVGEALTHTLPGRQSNAKILVKAPDSSEHVIRPTQSDDRFQVFFSGTARPGIYQMMFGSNGPSSGVPGTAASKRPPERTANDSESSPSLGVFGTQKYAVNVDTRESDLEAVDEKTLQSTTLAGIPFLRRSEWSNDPAGEAASAAGRSGLSTWMLGAILALLVVEPILAWSFRDGFILLLTAAACGLAAVFVPRNLLGGTIVSALLAGGIVTILLDRRGPRQTPMGAAASHSARLKRHSDSPLKFR